MADLLLTLPADDAQARLVRGEVHAWSTSAGFSKRLSEDVQLVASELFSNAVRASTTQAPIDVRLRSEPGTLTVSLHNVGLGFDLDAVPPPSTMRPGGRGIAIARALGALTVEQSGDRTTVRVVLREALAPSSP